jgi:hypothetical protein
MQTITRDEVREIVSNTKGQFFNVEFKKRTTGELRNMTARVGVSKYITGEGLKYNAKDKDLLPVYDMIAKGYRMVSIDGITQLRTNGETYIVI